MKPKGFTFLSISKLKVSLIMIESITPTTEGYLVNFSVDNLLYIPSDTKYIRALKREPLEENCLSEFIQLKKIKRDRPLIISASCALLVLPHRQATPRSMINLYEVMDTFHKEATLHITFFSHHTLTLHDPHQTQHKKILKFLAMI